MSESVSELQKEIKTGTLNMNKSNVNQQPDMIKATPAPSLLSTYALKSTIPQVTLIPQIKEMLSPNIPGT